MCSTTYSELHFSELTSFKIHTLLLEFKLLDLIEIDETLYSMGHRNREGQVGNDFYICMCNPHTGISC